MTQAMSKTLRMIAVAGVYFIAGKLGLLLANVHTSVSPVWPATGIALAALLGWGIELWPAVFIGALLVNVSAALPADTSILLRVAQALGIGIGNTLEALVAAQLVIRFAGARNPFQQVANVFRYTFLAGSLSTAVSATIGTLTLLACGFMRAHAYPAAWLTWWLGDMIGAMLVAPLILLWTAKPGLRPGMNRTVEALLLLISILMISAINFSDLFPFGAKHYPLTFFFLPFILWAALRFESRGVVAFLALITCLAINGTWHGYGSYAMAGQNGSLLMLQTFICVATFAALVLAAAVNERKTAEEQYRKLNLELEQRVQQRTAQLEGTNKELEAFCYSVSHDLRAPLRTIRGFSEVLLEQYKPQLDARGQDFLKRTCDAGLQMDKLIEDLLKLSRVSRNEIQQTQVNLSAMAHEIAADLAKSEPVRTVEFSISPGVQATGDERLMRLVMDNLLRNAWKFTKKRPDAKIEFGRSNGELSPFFVRDNGVGFDMAYAGKLFGVFQRLHSASEFAGSGVGLAIVQRVINRHGGRVWADAKVNAGATFYFTLPSTKGSPN
ncbi:MAG TPA: MASE1 domain-containing protein [Candidatus Polarisedimenticolia bacterium]|nr:MASE1 domain-containing protein [Candidatus Polarisedimenticolia bacterium]